MNKYDYQTCAHAAPQVGDTFSCVVAIDNSHERCAFAARNGYAFINHGDRLKRPETPLASRQRL